MADYHGRCSINIYLCLTCGACCACYRATFYWQEMDEWTSGGVLSGMTVKIDDFYAAMNGTQLVKPRCISLDGTVGEKVYCRIYENRPSACRNLQPSWQTGQHNIKYDKARLAWGLKPLFPEIWLDTDNMSRSV